MIHWYNDLLTHDWLIYWFTDPLIQWSMYRLMSNDVMDGWSILDFFGNQLNMLYAIFKKRFAVGQKTSFFKMTTLLDNTSFCLKISCYIQIRKALKKYWKLNEIVPENQPTTFNKEKKQFFIKALTFTIFYIWIFNSSKSITPDV